MGLLSSLKGVFKGKTILNRLDIQERFKVSARSIDGGMSKFFLVQEISSGQKYGLKILDAAKTQQFRDRFKGEDLPSEGEIAMQLKHANIVQTYETGLTTDGNEYLLVEFVTGPRLDKAMRKHPQEIAKRSTHLFPQMIRAVQAVHDAEFIHRDVCPRNFIVDPKLETIKLFDFGLTLPNLPPFRQPKNRTGTPLYMAPEIVRRRATDQRVDIFSLGITFYQMISGKHPWGADVSSGKSALTFDSFAPTDIRTHVPEIDEKLASAIHRCIEADPEKRFDEAKRILTAFRSS